MLFNSSAISNRSFLATSLFWQFLFGTFHSGLRSYTKEIIFPIPNIFRDENKALMCLARNNTTHWRKRPEKTNISRRSMSVHVIVARRDRDCLYLKVLVCSAVVGRVCRCKISAKCGCSATTAL